MRRAAIGVLVLAGCGGGSFADVGGSIGDSNFDSVERVYHGGPFLLFLSADVECIDTAWIQKTYNEGAALSDTEFVALQFGADGDSFTTGTFSVAGDAQVASFGLLNLDGALEVERAREGTLTLDVVQPDVIEGTFDIAWADSTSVRSTAFRSEYCSNINP